ncbi:DUF2815 family protein [Clostridium sp. C2-6-12]|uniref:DUF2815 family protein n=1 Tax=Clostridium sp. C2-6-12 TaxID=2698832 RepID=UPI001371F602|nr:DUF2815 family protein [Clostridium sp. C2-6-12]
MNTKIITGIVKLAYAHIFEPYTIEGMEDCEPRYSTTVIIPKTDTETLRAINAAIAQAQIGFSNKKYIKTLPRDGDLERQGDPLYKGCYFFNANSKNKPGIVDSNVNTIVGPMQVKNGYYAKVSFNLYSYNSNGNKGIAAGLNNIQLIGGAM